MDQPPKTPVQFDARSPWNYYQPTRQFTHLPMQSAGPPLAIEPPRHMSISFNGMKVPPFEPLSNDTEERFNKIKNLKTRPFDITNRDS